MSAMRTSIVAAGCAMLAAVCLTSIARAQTSWWRTYGGGYTDEACSVQQTADGGYIIAGLTTSFGPGDFDVYLIKTSAQGDTLWTRTYGGTRDDWGYSVQQTWDGGYVITGGTESFGPGAPTYSNVYLIKANASGDTLWTRTYGGPNDDDWGNAIQSTPDGGYIIAGYARSFGMGNGDAYLVKTNAEGDTLWTRTHGGAFEDVGNSIQQTSDSGYIITGYTKSFGAGKADVYLIKTDAQGDTLWTRTFGGVDDDVGFSVHQTSDGGYVTAGYVWSFGAGNQDVYLITTSASGDSIWARTYGGQSNDNGRSVQQTADGGYVIAGYTQSFGAGNDVYLIKCGASGDTLWTRAYGGEGMDCGNSVLETSSGGFIIGGYTHSFGAGNGDVYLIKTDAEGNVAVAEENLGPQAQSHGLATIVIRSLPQGAVAFDATGRRVLHPKPGIYFLRTEASAVPRKVLLVE